MTLYENRTFPNERDLYGVSDVRLVRCAFEGVADGESALKESRDIVLDDCRFALRYPLWHVEGASLANVDMLETCRAALWYARRVHIADSRLHGIKALRECDAIDIAGTDVVSAEFGWKCRDIHAENSSFQGEYPFLELQGGVFTNCRLKGKYSFQYAQNLVFDHCDLDTKDAFWHCRNVVVRDSTVRGEYLAWYSEGLTLERCRIIGTQPLCYAKGLVLRDCTMEDCDLSFEYSEVDADVQGRILSVKNPRSGRIIADSFGDILFTADARKPCTAQVVAR